MRHTWRKRAQNVRHSHFSHSLSRSPTNQQLLLSFARCADGAEVRGNIPQTPSIACAVCVLAYRTRRIILHISIDCCRLPFAVVILGRDCTRRQTSHSDALAPPLPLHIFGYSFVHACAISPAPSLSSSLARSLSYSFDKVEGLFSHLPVCTTMRVVVAHPTPLCTRSPVRIAPSSFPFRRHDACHSLICGYHLQLL